MSVQDYFLLMILISCAITDFLWQKIYNWITFPSIIAGFILSIYLNGVNGFFLSLLAFLFGFFTMFIFYLGGTLKEGDIKLMATIGAIEGSLEFVFLTIFYSLFIGGIIGIFILIWKKDLIGTLKNILILFKRFLILFLNLFLPKKKRLKTPQVHFKLYTMPFGIAISLAALYTLLSLKLSIFPILFLR